ncbi:MAG: endonuclease V [Conexivisphaerales archaeon]|jgi:deoxyribonuclease V
MPSKSRPSFKDFFPYATLVQSALAKLYVPSGIKADDIKATAALDVSYSKDRAYTVAVVWSPEDGKAMEVQTGVYGVHFPYIPGYLHMREAPPLLRILSQVESAYDLILVDAHGRLHPRRAGLATIVGVLTGKPTIGVAKSLLTGEIKGVGKVRPIHLGGEVEGLYVCEGRAFYASPGNLMSIEEIERWLRARGLKYPDELTMADALSKKLRVTSESADPS